MGKWWVLVASCLGSSLPACSPAGEADRRAEVDSTAFVNPIDHVDGVLAPLPPAARSDDPRIALGRRLFNDARLSKDGRVSCANCHSPARGGANGEFRSTLPDRGPVKVNVPTVFNLAYDFRYSWSGRFVDLGAQIDVAMGLPDAMNTTWADATSRIRQHGDYQAAFQRAYADGLSAENLRDALIRYNLSLTTPDGRFDRYLRGEIALTGEEARGYRMFREYGCVSCHQGVNVGGNMFQKFGVMRDYFAERGGITEADLGLYNTTRRDEDRHVFRVPSLRNVALTAPYFHDGAAPTLHTAVQTMARYQLGRELSDAQASDIVAFLNTLTGVLSEDAL